MLGNELASSGGPDWPAAAVDLHMPHAVEIRDNVVSCRAVITGTNHCLTKRAAIDPLHRRSGRARVAESAC